MVVVRRQGNAQFPGPGPIQGPQGGGHGAVIEDRHLGLGDVFPQVRGRVPGALQGKGRRKRLAGVQIIDPENYPALDGGALPNHFVDVHLANDPVATMAQVLELMLDLPIQGGDDGPDLEFLGSLALRSGKGHGVIAELAGDLRERPHPGLVDQGTGLDLLDNAVQVVIIVVFAQVELLGALHFLRGVVTEGQEGVHALGRQFLGRAISRHTPAQHHDRPLIVNAHTGDRFQGLEPGLGGPDELGALLGQLSGLAADEPGPRGPGD